MGLMKNQMGYYQSMADKLILEGTTSSVAAGGNLELNVDLVDCTKIHIHQIIVSASASTDFDFEIYPDDTFTTYIYQNIDNNLYLNDQPIRPFYYVDDDGTSSKELHLKFVNTDSGNASTFTYRIVYGKIE
jgi:hypothetical protein